MKPGPIPDPEQTLRTGDVARALGVSPRAVRAWADAGKISCYRTFGGQRLFPVSEVLRVVEKLRGDPPERGYPPEPPTEEGS